MLATLLLSLTALAAVKPAPQTSGPPIPADLTLTCVTEFPTTSFVIFTQGDNVVAHVIHHNGSGYAPAIVGTFTPNDLPLLTERAEQVKKMKSDMTFHWPKEKCQRKGELLIQCFGTDDVEVGEGGAKFAPFALYSTNTVEDGIAGRQESTSMTMTFDVDDHRDVSIEMKYPKGGCSETRSSAGR